MTFRAHSLVLFSTVVLINAGCLLAPNDTQIGSNDAGAGGGGVAGGSGGGVAGGSGGGVAGGSGGGVAGGSGGGSGGGTVTNPIIPGVTAVLTPAQCAVAQAPTGTCSGTADCLLLHRQNQTPLPLTNAALESDYPTQTLVLTTDISVYFMGVPSGSAGQFTLWKHGLAGGGPTALLSWPWASKPSVIAALSGPTATWFAVSESQSGVRVQKLYRAPQGSTVATFFANLPAAAITLGYPANAPVLAEGRNTMAGTVYVVANERIYGVTAGGVPFEISGTVGANSIVADETGLYFTRTLMVAGAYQSTVEQFTTTSSMALRTLIGPITDNFGAAVLVGPTIFAVARRAVYSAPTAGGPSTVVYNGQPFPQYFGTLMPGLIRFHNEVNAQGTRSLLFVGQVCEFDADAPSYGVVELDLGNQSAAWLNTRPAAPYNFGVLGDANLSTHYPWAIHGTSGGELVVGH